MRRHLQSGRVQTGDRTAPFSVTATQAANRLPEFLALRDKKMRSIVATFFRAAAADRATLPRRVPVTQRCGDAHLAFGTCASPGGDLPAQNDDFETAIADFAYADCTELDHALFCVALDAGSPAVPCKGRA